MMEKALSLARLGLLAGVACAPALWLDAPLRHFPTLPLWGEAGSGPAWGYAGIAGLALALVLGTFFPAKKWPTALLLLWLALLVALDLGRLQPWVWFYALLLGLGKFAAPPGDGAALQRNVLASVYAWGGLHKLSPYFAEDNFPWFCEAFDLTRPLGAFPALGYAVALFEFGLALGLLWPRSRALFRYLAVGFHLLIVIFLAKKGWNYVVLPWNAIMALLAWVLFAPAEAPMHNLPQGPANRVFCVLLWVLPGLGLVGLWPYNLSWRLYANTQPEAVFVASAPCAQWQRVWQQHAYDNGHQLLLDDWTNSALKAPPFYAERSFKQWARHLCRCTPRPDSAGLAILRVRPWDKSAENTRFYRCAELLE
jgi:hypothetical protein